ncbi:MAG: hypothetical protein AB7I27_12425 [Bacteriovoracaceae bacterium]
MKAFLVMVTLLASSLSFAQAPSCGAAYARGLNHFFKGESIKLGDKEIVAPGQTVKDKYYTLSVSSEGVPSLTETKSKKPVELVPMKLENGASMYSTASLELYPKGVPGAVLGSDGKHNFILIVCANF